MATTRPAHAERPPRGSSLSGVYILCLGAALAGNLLIRVAARQEWLGAWGLLALALLTAAPLAVAAGFFWRLLRRDLDEMLQRILLEGMAFALTAYVPVAALYVNLQAAGASLPRLDAPDILMTPALLVVIGVVIATRRYV